MSESIELWLLSIHENPATFGSVAVLQGCELDTVNSDHS